MITNLCFYSLKSDLPSREKIFQDIQDIKKNANAILNAVPLDTFDDYYVQLWVPTCWKTSTSSSSNCEKVVKHTMVNVPCEIWGFLPQHLCWGFCSSGMLHCEVCNITYSDVLKEHSNFIFKGWGHIRSSRTYQSWWWSCYTASKCQGMANYPLHNITP